MARIISISEDIKEEIARKVVEQAHPGYSVDYQGQWYVVDGSSVQHKQRNAPWAPWSDDSAVIAVDDLVNIYGGADDENAVFSLEDTSGYSDEEQLEIAVEFALGYVPDSYDAEAYEARYA